MDLDSHISARIHKHRRPAWAWVSSLFFANELPWMMASVLAIELLMQLRLDDSAVTFYVSWLFLPWVFKPLWSAFAHQVSPKHKWIGVLELLTGTFCVGVAFAIQAENWLLFTLFFLFVASLMGAIHSAFADSLLKVCAEPEDTKFLTALKIAFNRLSMVFANGLVIMFVGVLQVIYRNQIRYAWSLVFYILAGFFIAFFLLHSRLLPREKGQTIVRKAVIYTILKRHSLAIKALFARRQAIASVVFLCLFAIPMTLLLPISQLFLQASGNRGGLALAPQEFGLAYGTVALSGLFAGAMWSGTLIKRDGFRRWIWPMAAAMGLPNILYVYLSYAMPTSLLLITLCLLVVNLGWGFGLNACVSVISESTEGRHQATFRPLLGAVFMVVQMLSCLASGSMADALGYRSFFIVAALCSVLPFIATIFICKGEFIGTRIEDNLGEAQ